MNLYIYENHQALDLEPVALTRPAFDLKSGSSSFLERILKQFSGHKICLFVRTELEEISREQWPDLEINPKQVKEGLWLLGNVFWSLKELELLQNASRTLYFNQETLVAAKLSAGDGEEWLNSGGPLKNNLQIDCDQKELSSPYCRYLWNILDLIPTALEQDKLNVTFNSQNPVQENIEIISRENVFISSSAEIETNVVINGQSGPVIIDDQVTIKAHSYLEGPLSLGRNTLIKPFTQIKNSIVGPECKLGGEINTVIIQAYSNKVHDGFLGNSYLGEWVNLGAGTQISNLKNNYTNIIVQVNGNAVDTDQILIGSFMGDHVKTAIGTILNSGTVLGPGCLIAAAGFPSRTIRPFTWYVSHRHKPMIWEKFITTVNIVESRRGKKITEAQSKLLKSILENR